MPFNPSEFLKSELTLDKVKELIKPNLLLVAKALNLTVDGSSNKSDLRRIVVSELISNELLNDDALDSLEKETCGQMELEMMKLKLKEREIELHFKERELIAQSEKEEREMKLKQI